jgi:hypothetical protein
VTSDRRAASAGSVSGTLGGMDLTAPQNQLAVSGSWTCTWGPNLGPG